MVEYDVGNRPAGSSVEGRVSNMFNTQEHVSPCSFAFRPMRNRNGSSRAIHRAAAAPPSASNVPIKRLSHVTTLTVGGERRSVKGNASCFECSLSPEGMK